MCSMLLKTKYRVLFVLPTKQALKGTIDLMRLNNTKVENFEQMNNSSIVFGNNKLYPKFSVEQRAMSKLMNSQQASRMIKVLLDKC
jgi:hypothetical protein